MLSNRVSAATPLRWCVPNTTKAKVVGVNDLEKFDGVPLGCVTRPVERHLDEVVTVRAATRTVMMLIYALSETEAVLRHSIEAARQLVLAAYACSATLSCSKKHQDQSCSVGGWSSTTSNRSRIDARQRTAGHSKWVHTCPKPFQILSY